MIVALTLILLCQFVGEVVARGTGWPVPGPVIGMALLLAFLAARDHAPEFLPPELADGTLEAAGKGLLAHLTLLFVPTGVGVVQRLDVFASYGFGLAVALVVSTVLTLVATVAMFLLVLTRQPLPRDAGAKDKNDARQGRAILTARAAALRLGRFGRQQRLDRCPKRVGHKGPAHAP
jgi:putative effector of murein hydrolase LrgA (UPF0299 family)